jgi:hypothetical protein
MAINSNALAEMDVPESYLDSLPKVHHKCEHCHVPIDVVPVHFSVLTRFFL